MELLITIIVLALIFDYYQRFHDAANRNSYHCFYQVLTSASGCNLAAFFNFLAFFIAKYLIGDFGIANTVSKTVYEQYITLPVILSGVIAAIIWNLWTWWRGIPSSSSHTLIGGFAGAPLLLMDLVPFKFGYPENRAFHFSGSSHRYACSLPLHSDSAESVP